MCLLWKKTPYETETCILHHCADSNYLIQLSTKLVMSVRVRTAVLPHQWHFFFPFDGLPPVKGHETLI